jgi:alcohol dehydrogenase class IV
MEMRFEFATVSRIIFGSGSLAELKQIAPAFGSRSLAVISGNVDRARPLFDLLGEIPFVRIEGEPTLDRIRAAVPQALDRDLVIGFGGGSALDSAKAIAALATNPGDPLDYLEVIGSGKPLVNAPLPFIGIPTTAGTGSEVTSNAVLASPEKRVKVSLRSPAMLAKVALVDPDLTLSLPSHLTAASGIDAIAQVLEPYVSKFATPITNALGADGLRRAGALRRAFEHGSDREAREQMSMISLLGGLALSNAKLGAAHGFAGPLGGMFPAPHGALVGALLPHVMAINVAALRSRAPEGVHRYDEAAALLTGKADADAGCAFIRDLVQHLGIPRLSTYGIREADFPAIVEQAARASSMKGNPIVLTTDELTEILARAL